MNNRSILPILVPLKFEGVSHPARSGGRLETEVDHWGNNNPASDEINVDKVKCTIALIGAAHQISLREFGRTEEAVELQQCVGH